MVTAEPGLLGPGWVARKGFTLEPRAALCVRGGNSPGAPRIPHPPSLSWKLLENPQGFHLTRPHFTPTYGHLGVHQGSSPDPTEPGCPDAFPRLAMGSPTNTLGVCSRHPADSAPATWGLLRVTAPQVWPVRSRSAGWRRYLLPLQQLRPPASTIAGTAGRFRSLLPSGWLREGSRTTPGVRGTPRPLADTPRQQPALSRSALGSSLSSPDPSPLCSMS